MDDILEVTRLSWALGSPIKPSISFSVLLGLTLLPRGSIYTTIMELGPQNRNGHGLLAPNSIMAVYMTLWVSLTILTIHIYIYIFYYIASAPIIFTLLRPIILQVGLWDILHLQLLGFRGFNLRTCSEA